MQTIPVDECHKSGQAYLPRPVVGSDGVGRISEGELDAELVADEARAGILTNGDLQRLGDALKITPGTLIG